MHQITVGGHPITAPYDGLSRLPPMFFLGLHHRTRRHPIPGTPWVRYLEENIAAESITLTPAELAPLDEAAPPGAAPRDRYPAGQMPSLNQ